MLQRWVGASALVLALQLAVGCGSGQNVDGDGGMDKGGGSGEVGEVCQSASDCDAVAYPECVDLAETGTTRCESVCESNADCSDNAQCIALDVGGICLVPCSRDANCQEDWVCAVDSVGVGFCLWPSAVSGTDTGTGGDGDGDLDGGSGGGLSINEPCTADAQCAALYPVCNDWGDGVARCTGACLAHTDCGQPAAGCILSSATSNEGVCLQECAALSDCPSGWGCEATDNGPSFCVPPPSM